MNRILQTRRTFKTKKVEDWTTKTVKNPLYNVNIHRRYEEQGYDYYHEEYIDKDIPITRTKKVSHIEYRIKCDHCKSTKNWVRRKDAKYCCSNCRKLASIERKKAKAKELQ